MLPFACKRELIPAECEERVWYLAELAYEVSFYTPEERRAERKRRPEEQRWLSNHPLVLPPTRVALEARDGSKPPTAVATPPSSASDGSVSTVMTVTIEGSLEGPPPFDSAAFTAKLADKLDMRGEQFQVKRVKKRDQLSRVGRGCTGHTE